MADRRILITGGSGFLGSVLAHQAARRDYDVWATYLHNSPPEAERILHEQLDLQKEGEIAGLLKRVNPQVVIHTAYSQNDRGVTLGGTARLVSCCGRLREAPYFIYLSTDLVFEGEKGRYTENDLPVPVMNYGRDKLDAEKVVAEQLPGALIARSSLFYDLERVPTHLRFAVDAIRCGRECVFFRDEYRSPLLVEELAGALLKLAEMRYSGLLHLAGADRVSRWWFGPRLLRTLGFPTHTLRAGSVKDIDSPRPADCSLDSSRAEKLLGMRFRGAKAVLGEM